MTQTFTSVINHLDKLNMHYITVTEEILQSFADEETKSVFNQRFNVTVNGAVSWKGGSVSLGDRTAYITLSAARMKKLGVKDGDKVEVCLEKDNSEFGFDIPVEFTEVLNQDDEARMLFNELRKSFQRYIIYLVIQYKTSDKRIEKSLFYLENLKRSPRGETTMRHILGKDLP